MSGSIKRAVYHAAKWAGGFGLARRLMRGRLRILAYHGFAIAGEDLFRPQLFMKADLFGRRMEYLRRKGYAVLPLSQAAERLARGQLPNDATVITFDDGFYSTWKLAGPIMQNNSLPGTIYVTTYYCLKRNPVFRLVVQYMFWKTDKDNVDLHGLGLGLEGSARLGGPPARREACWKIIDQAERDLSEDRRVALCRTLGERLGVDYESIVRGRFLSLMTPEEIGQAAADGLDIQLHTHRHRMPGDIEGLQKEIIDNRQALKAILGREPAHLCYPSGVFRMDQCDALGEMGVLTATTCESGLNGHDTAPLALSRFLDGNNISWIEFEAEMSGFAELCRAFARPVKRWRLLCLGRKGRRYASPAAE